MHDDLLRHRWPNRGEYAAMDRRKEKEEEEKEKNSLLVEHIS